MQNWHNAYWRAVPALSSIPSTVVPDPGTGNLHGTRVLVTRPAPQAQALAQRIEQAGGEAIILPSIEIAGPADETGLEQLLNRLEQFDIAIFISRNSVQQALDRIQRCRGQLPPTLRIAAVGAGTARALAERGHAVTIAPETQYRSESLLDTDALQEVAGQRVIIFRGEGGRELLADTLRARGAQVEYAECYRRLRPRTDTTAIEQRWKNGDIDIVIVTSLEGLENLDAMLGETGRALLRETPIVVIGARTVAACRRLGLKKPLVASEASDEALVAAVDAWRRSQNTV